MVDEPAQCRRVGFENRPACSSCGYLHLFSYIDPSSPALVRTAAEPCHKKTRRNISQVEILRNAGLHAKAICLLNEFPFGAFALP